VEPPPEAAGIAKLGRYEERLAIARDMTPGRDAHGHDHGPHIGSDSRFLWLALSLIAVFMVFEVVVALASGSLALLADAGHMLTDVGAIGASIWAIRLARQPARGSWTYGFKRSEILSAAVNGVTLLVVSALVAYEAIRRLIDPPKVTGAALLVVAGVGIVINVAASLLLARADRSKLNIEGAYQHILTDAFAFIATLIAGVVIIATGFRRADSIASLCVVLLMVRAAVGLLKRSGRILLEAAPDGVNLDDVRAHILGAEHVRGVHDLHAWVVTSDLPALSAHVVVDDSCFNDGHAPRILDHLQSCLAGHFDVEHSTFQLESSAHADHEAGAHN
jgi:cobalt-zinc-cadmium efflux system protein